MLQSKLPLVGTTIFTTMSKLAQEHQAINLAQGFPNFPVDERLLELFQKNLRENYHQYAPMAGSPKLIQEIQKMTLEQYDRVVSDQEVLVCSGATQAIFTVIQTLVHPNDEVIVLDPAYDCYDPAILLQGARAVRVAMENDYTVDWNKVEAAITSKTKLLVVNNPHNPTARVFTDEDIKSLQVILEKHEQVYLLSDEVYEYITFEQKHLSAHQLQKLLDRILVVSSFGKTFHITGWKMGYLIAPEALMKEIKKVHQFLVFSVNHLAQQSIAEYLREVDLCSLGSFYQEKRDYFISLLRDSRFKLIPSEGTYFISADYGEISKQNDGAFAQELVEKHGVAAIPLSGFYDKDPGNTVLRFCFAKDNLTLEQAAEKLCKI